MCMCWFHLIEHCEHLCVDLARLDKHEQVWFNYTFVCIQDGVWFEHMCEVCLCVCDFHVIECCE